MLTFFRTERWFSVLKTFDTTKYTPIKQMRDARLLKPTFLRSTKLDYQAITVVQSRARNRKIAHLRASLSASCRPAVSTVSLHSFTHSEPHPHRNSPSEKGWSMRKGRRSLANVILPPDPTHHNIACTWNTNTHLRERRYCYSDVKMKHTHTLGWPEIQLRWGKAVTSTIH